MTDIRSKSIPEIVAITEARIRELLEKSWLDQEDMLRARGATQDEIEASLSITREQNEATVAAFIGRLPALLRRGGDELH